MDADLRGAEFRRDPYSTLARLRERGPVAHVILPNGQRGWVVTRFDDVIALLKDVRFAKDRRNAGLKQDWMPRSVRAVAENMLDLDPPQHTRLRALVQRAFTPGRVAMIRARIEALTHELIDRVVSRREMDVIADYALPLPTTIISEMLGVPRADQQKFHRWSQRIVAADSTRLGPLLAIPALFALVKYIRQLIESRRRTPTNDLLGALVAAEESGDQLSSDELVAMVFLLLVAGHETTVNLIGNGVLALLQHPQQMELLRSRRELIVPGVEEMLRYDGPLKMATERFAREDVVFAGASIPRGSWVFGCLAAANRDERQFAEPDTFDVTREPNRHIAFGFGTHYCVGAPLARLEAQIAIGTALQRLEDVELAIPQTRLEWRPALVLRGLDRLPVRFAEA